MTSRPDSQREQPEPLRRKSTDFVTIAHVSDTHFLAMGGKQGNVADKVISAFGRELRDANIDLLCISGDIVGNPIGSWMQVADRPDYSPVPARGAPKRKEGLAEAFRVARNQFENWCREWDIGFDRCVFVVPGNHDLEPGARATNQAMANDNYDDKALDLFKRSFAPQFRDDELLFDHPHGVDIGVRIFCISSNDASPSVNFARGCISTDKIMHFQEAIRDPRRLAEESGEDFNLCLLHHHPLPVPKVSGARLNEGESERPELGNSTLRPPRKRFAGSSETPSISREDAADTFVNAGTFTSFALQRGVNLILHGHQHRSFFKVLEHPNADTCSRLMVVGAGSLAREINSKFHYNIIRLYGTGNIEVEHRAIDAGNLMHSTETKLVSMGEHRLRIHRFENRRRSILGTFRNGVSQTSGATRSRADDGRAYVDTVTRIVRIAANGDAHVTVSMTGVRAVGEALGHIRLAAFSSENAFDQYSCKVTMSAHSSLAPSTSCALLDFPDSKQDGKQEVFVRFKPPLPAFQRGDVSVSYRVAKAFEFVAGTDTEEHEHVTMSCSTVFPEHLQIVVLFPDNWTPSSKPWATVVDKKDRSDQAEIQYASSKLMYLKDSGIAALTIERPLPGLSYGLKWPKDKRKSPSVRRKGSRGRPVSMRRGR